MTKFTLILWVCAFLNPTSCLEPVKYPKLFDSWYECTRFAHHESMKLYSKMGYKYVNENKIATRYNCLSVSAI